MHTSLLLLTFLSLFLSFIALIQFLKNKALKKRINQLNRSTPILEKTSSSVISSLKSKITKALNSISPKNTSRSFSQKEYFLLFEQAGLKSSHAISLSIFYRFILFLIFACLSYFAHRYLPRDMGLFSNQNVWMFISLLIGAGSTALFKPILRMRIKSRNQIMISNFLTVIDVIIVTLRTGLSLERCIEEATQEVGIKNSHLQRELTILSVELQLLDREKALLNFRQRFKSSISKEFVSIIIQSQKQGSSMFEGLKIIATEWRKKHFSALENNAQKLPVKITIITAVCFLPPLFMFTLGPLLLRNISSMAA